MWLGIIKIARLIAVGSLVIATAGGGWWLVWYRARIDAVRRRRERRIGEESRAYTRLDVRLAAGMSERELARQVCRVVAEHSAFRRVAMLCCEEGRLAVTASVGMEGATLRSLEAWCGRIAEDRRGGVGIRRGENSLGETVGGVSVAVILAERPALLGYERVVVTPFWTLGGRMIGALVVGADSMKSVRPGALEAALEPLETLAVKLARSMENAALAEKLLCTERLAGLGMMAGGMAHALNNPLTAVIGFAELIANTTGEARVKADAAIIVREALRMRQTVESVLDFGRPAAACEEQVEVMEVVRALAAECAEKLESRGVRLVVQATEDELVLRANRHRLREMLEHLLNNASQALAAAALDGSGEEMVIRVSVCQDTEAVHLVVSDTGKGFREPGTVFDPFVRKGGSRGMGLAICHGIVREHGGEIRAFNMHPHGAAVAVELPRAGILVEKNPAGAGSRTVGVSG
jgi:signal transduction histidine kinase